MSPQSPQTLLQDTYSIKEAADLVNRAAKTIERWCQKGKLEGATKVHSPKGDVWSIPAAALAKIIEEKNLTIHLDTESSPQSSQSGVSPDKLYEVMAEAAATQAREAGLLGQNEQLTVQVKRLSGDNDHLRAEYERTQAALVESERERGKLEGQLEHAQDNAKAAEEKRDSLDLEHRELQKTSAESLSAVSADLETARNDVDQAKGESDELAAKLEAAEASMGWWTRRKYQR